MITADATGSVDENADGGTVVSVATENADTVTVDDDRFEVAGGNLKLKAGTTLDFESDSSPIEVTITASGAGDSATHTVSVSINDVNEDFTITAADGSVDENADGASVGAVTVTDPDAGDTHTYTVSDDRFEVAGGMLKLKDGETLDYETETSITVTITATDGGGHSNSVDATVTVNDVNEAPSISVADGAVDENDAGAVVGAVTASDPDAGDTHTYAVSDDRFEVAGGMLKLKDGMTLDHEAAGSVAVTVTVTDAAGLSASTDVTVTVNNVNEAPAAPELRGLPRSVDENDEGAIVASLETGSDPEGDAVSFSVSDDRFEVIAGGVLKLKDDETLNYEEEGGSVEVVVTAMDPSGLVSEPTIVTVEIEDENEAPSIMAADARVDENDTGAVLSAITLSDEDAGDTHTVRINDFRFTVITDDQGGMWIALKEDESIDFEEEDSVPLTLTVTDAGGLSGTVDVTITVNDVNENPSVSVASGITPGGVIAASTVDENNAGAPLGEITVSDPDAGDTYTLSVSDPRFEAAQDHLGGWWVKLVDGTALDFETEESVALTVTVTDAGGLTGTADVTITVRNVDEAPSAPVVRDGALSIDENHDGASITSLADSTDPEGDAITYTVDDDRFEITSGLVLKLKDGMALDHETEASVTLTLTASDPAGNDSDATMVDITVNDLNEAPEITVADGSVDENAAGAAVGAVMGSDVDDGDTMTYTVSDDRFEVAGGMLKLKDDQMLDHETEDSVMVTVTVTDSGDLSDSMDVTVAVNDLNEAPEITTADGSVDENAAGAAVGAVSATDVDDGDTMTYSVSDDRFEVAGGMLKLKDDQMLDHETEDSVTVTVKVTDSGDLSDSMDVTVGVNDVNEAPRLRRLTVPWTRTPRVRRSARVSATDVDDGDTMTYTVSDDRFEVAGGMLKLKDDQMLDHETEDSVTVTVTVTDSGDLSDSMDVTVGVNDVNEAPEITTADGSVDENAAGAAVGAVSAADVDDGDTMTYSVSDDRFEVAGGMLKLKDDQMLDHETDSSVTVTVTVTDSGDLSDSMDVTVTVNNVDEGTPAPTVVNADNLSVDENDAGAAITSVEAVMDPEGGAITYHVDDDRFEIDSGRVLRLKDGMALDHESEATVTLAITARDDADNVSEAAVVTVAVNDVNEAPSAAATVADITPESGTAVNMEVDLLALFSDPDDGDSVGGWRLSGNPSWLELVVVYGTDDDGNNTVTGYLRGTPPTTGPESDAVHMATITANDDDGLTSSTSFYVIVDDGNDAVDRVNLLNADGSVNVNLVVDVDENDASGVVLGGITVDDQDHPNHPHGQHMVTVDDDRFEIREDDDGNLMLALKAGESLDHEKEGGFVTVTVKAVDMNGEKDAQGNYLGLVGMSDEITVNINDVNEAPVANTIGNWWVTVNNALVESQVGEGDWLSFGLDTEAPGTAFTDPEGDTLEYSISGPSWIQIDEDDGTITNKAEMTPNPGAYPITVTASDPDGLTATNTFTLYVAESAVVGGDANVGNRQPTISLTTGSSQYTEGSGDRRIATLRAEDDDQDLEGHPFAIETVQIISVANLGDTTDTNNWALADGDPSGYATAFRLGDPVKSGNTLTYGLHVMDTNSSAMTDTTDVLNYEDVLNIRLVVRVTDGAGKSSDVTVDVRINDANEAPEVVEANAPTTANLTVEQSADAVSLIYINLNEMWEDPDIGDVDALLKFTATTSTSWIDILHGPERWQTVQLGPDGVSGTADDVTWGGTGTPAASDFVVVVELDRTRKEQRPGRHGQLHDHRDGRRRRNGYLYGPGYRHRREPGCGRQRRHSERRRQPTGRRTPDAPVQRGARSDLAGSDSAALVVYTWETHVDADDNGEPDTAPGAGTTIMVTTSDAPLTLTQAHVGLFVSVSVSYYEVFGGSFTAAQAGGSAVTSKAVADSQDRGSAHFNILTSGETLTAEVRIDDDDGLPAVPAAVTDTYPDVDGDGTADYVTYTWEVSDNGRGGWTTVDADDATNDLTLTLANGNGKFYRLVATYTDDAGGSERHTSDAVQIGDLPTTVQPVPTVTGSANPGGSLSVNAPGASVQWQKMMAGNWVDIPGATGSLGLTASDAGSSVRAVVTYTSSNPSAPAGATAIVATAATSIGGTPTAISPVTVQANHYIEASVDVAHAATSGGNPGKTAVIEETVDLRSLFQDPDSARLSFAVTSTLGSDEATGDDNTLQITSDGGVLVFEETSGKLTYVSDVTHGHDGAATDGAGNLITLAVVASDGSGTDATANVHLRINVAPTGITFATNPITNIAENERAAGTEVVATLNVQDENFSGDGTLPAHAFGTHTITVSDDRFVITNTGDGRQDGDGDASTWDLRLKRGATFDFETDDMDPTTDGTQVVLTFTATDGGGLSTPTPSSTNGYSAITLTITIDNDTDDDPATPTPQDVPGLVDDEDTDPPGNDERTDDATDEDNDGGSQPPPPGMSLGQIEDFVDNMNAFEQDLLEDFMLVIDDSIDIA